LASLKTTGELAGIQKKVAALKEEAPANTKGVNGHMTPALKDATSELMLSAEEYYASKTEDQSNSHILEAANLNASGPLANGELEAYQHNQ
jgi:hypothetical protein